MTSKLKDIAAYLNISVSTVSRVINNKDRVHEETRQRVLEALKKFDYQPNEVARSLKSRSSKAIGLIIPNIANYFFSMIIKGVESITREQGYHLILAHSDEDKDRESEITDFLIQRQISGLIVAIVGREASFYEKYERLGIPIVFIDNMPKLEGRFDYVSIDNRKAACQLTEHLIKQGHKKIGIITGSLQENVFDERMRGWEQALKEHGLPIEKKWRLSMDYRQESGYRMMQQLLKEQDRPTAIVAANNLLAYGAMQALNDAGVSIPDEMALVCFDAIDFVGLIKPQLTSIVQPAEEIGGIAGEIIIRKIQNTRSRIYEQIILESELVIKESCGKRK